MDNERTSKDQFIEFIPNVPQTAPPPTDAPGPGRSRIRAAGPKSDSAPMTFRLPPAALGRWEAGAARAAADDGGQTPGSRRLAPPRAEAPTPSNDFQTATVSAGRDAHVSVAGPVRRGVAGVRPAVPPSREEQRDTRSGYQDEWLNTARRAETPLHVMLTNGATVSGRLINFDTYSLIVEAEQETILLFKHAICLVRPQALAPPEQGQGPGG